MSARSSTDGEYLVRFLDDPGPIKLPLSPAHYIDIPVFAGFLIQFSWGDFPGNSPRGFDVAPAGCGTMSIPHARVGFRTWRLLVRFCDRLGFHSRCF